ncbi:hypothetical protein [Spongiactinospora sp. TRM90649]|uniref:hypothetical protein n=1 Tax=Spongiactinospora sp. TRM90649 TaxID=3031114 RepID=UPI0023F9F24A|nr:hypothetical protein [Spongiactinospora sp. TRM90649]MDF5751208.1 hypothetical protein [Spongiactinospora sp. TRM90649]
MFLILGDLALDVIPEPVPARDAIERLALGDDATMRSGLSFVPGGSAMLFAESIEAHHPGESLIVAALGPDPAARILQAAMTAAGMATTGLEHIGEGTTKVVLLASFPDCGRLMLYPGSHTGDLLSTAFATRLLTTVDPASVRCLWLSGYCLTDRDAPRYEATRRICAWCHSNGVPVVLDLVPHDFADRVGDLAEVERRLGPLTGVIGEYTTFTELGFTPGWTDGTRGALASVAAAVSAERGFAVVQHRENASVYLQSAARAGVHLRTATYPIPVAGTRGLGDHMSVDALGWMGLATARRRATAGDPACRP